MTISSSTASASYTGNGTTTAFTIPFYFLVDTDVKISKKNGATGAITVLTLNSDYTLTGAGNQAGGTATLTVAPLGGTTPDQLFIERNVDAVQETAYPANSPFPAASHEKALDRLTMLVQQILSKLTFGLFRNPLAATYDLGGNTLSNIANAVNAQDVPSLHQVQELITDGAVPGLSGDAGSSLVGFKQAATGAVSRKVEDKLVETWSYKDFGAKMDGVTDDSAAMSALIAACAASGTAKRVIVPAGTSLLSQGFTITTPIRFVGEGQIGPADGSIPGAAGSTFKYTGAAGATFFKLSKVNRGYAGFEGINFDCNALAAYGLDFEDVLGTQNSVSIINFTHVGLKVGAPATTASWNKFDTCFIADGGHGDATSAAVWLTGTAAGGNACHNTFVNTHIDISGATHGIYLGGCDNNCFLMTYIYRAPGGTGHGVHVDPTEQTNFPVNNAFFHLQASTGGWYQPSTTASIPAFIYGYMQDNGEPSPILSTNGSLKIISPEIVYPVTVAAGTGWSGGTPTFSAYYVRNGRKVTLTINISGSAVVAGTNATITGIPANTGNTYGLGVVTGINTTSGNVVYGYISDSTLTLSSGISTTSSTQLQASFLL